MAKRVGSKLAPWQYWSQIKPHQRALITNDISLSWVEVANKVDQLAGNFVNQKKPLALLSDVEHHYATLLCLLAAWQQGVAVLVINPDLAPNILNKILKSAKITECHLANDFAATDIPFESNFDFDRPLSLTLTSGSTGLPKIVVHNAKQHLYSAKGLLKLMPFSEQNCWLLSLPLYHISGLAIIWRWLSTGAELKVADFRGDKLIEACAKATHASFVPAQLGRVLAQNQPSSLKSVLLGGSAISHSMTMQAKKKGIECWSGYGMTEMASTICAKRVDAVDSVGKVLNFRELMLSKEREILVKGKTLALGYFQQGKLIPMPNKWFATKDLGDWLENTELVIRGRRDNMFISGGENIQPEMIEQVLSAFPRIGQVIILPYANKKWGEVPVALIENTVDFSSFLAFAKARLAPYQVPHKILPIPFAFLTNGIKPSRSALVHWLKKMPLDEE